VGVHYAAALDMWIPHQHRDAKRRVYVLPGTEYLICKNAMAKLIGFDKNAWQNCKKFSTDDLNFKHGQARRKANNHNAAMKFMKKCISSLKKPSSLPNQELLSS
jgi:hypothetical protein